MGPGAGQLIISLVVGILVVAGLASITLGSGAVHPWLGRREHRWKYSIQFSGGSSKLRPAFGVNAAFLITSFAGGIGPVVAASALELLGGVVAAVAVTFCPTDRVGPPFRRSKMERPACTKIGCFFLEGFRLLPRPYYLL